MESRLNIPTCLFGGPPVQDDMIKLGQSQIGFMNVFARPLFDAVTDVLPAMQFSVDELAANKERWEKEIAQEKEKELQIRHIGKGPGLLHLKGVQNARFDGAMGTPSPKSRSTEFLVPVPTSNAPGPEGKSQSDPNPFASIEEQAEAKRRILNPSNVEFSDNNSSDHVALSPGTQNSTTPLTSNTNPSSRRGSADQSLTAILVTQSAPGANSADKSKKSKKDKKEKRASGDSQTAGLRSLSPGSKINQQSSNGSQNASEKGVAVAPDEGPGAVGDFNDAYERSDSVAVGAGVPNANGAVLPSGIKNGDGNGTPDLKKKKSKSSPQPLGQVASSDGTEDGEDAQKGKPQNKFSKFLKKKWRAVSGIGDNDAMRSREKLAVAHASPGMQSPGEDREVMSAPMKEKEKEMQGRVKDVPGTAP